METMYERLGGEAKIQQLIEEFHKRALQDPMLGTMFAEAKGKHVENLTIFFIEMFGGPARYSEELGAIEGLLFAHEHLYINNEQRQRFVDLMVETIKDLDFPKDNNFLKDFTKHIEAGSQFSMKFSYPEAELPPRPFPDITPWEWTVE